MNIEQFNDENFRIITEYNGSFSIEQDVILSIVPLKLISQGYNPDFQVNFSTTDQFSQNFDAIIRYKINKKKDELIKKYQLISSENENISMYDDERISVYNAIDSERDYQEKMKSDTSRPDMIPDLHIGDTIAAIQYNLDSARIAWYQGSVPHKEAMEFLRKIAGLVVQAGEEYGIPKR